MKLYLTTFLVATVMLPVAGAQADHNGVRSCSKTAGTLHRACNFDLDDDYHEAQAICINIADQGERSECYADARAERHDGRGLCREPLRARRDLCGVIGEDRYDMSGVWLAENFVDPEDIGGSVVPNPWFDLTPGTTQTYFGDGETIEVTVREEIKLINGVRCRTVTDLVTEDGLNVEDTDDWYGQDIYGNVWYCGEISKNFEFFEGDEPQQAELVDVDGSWKAFRDGAQPGILFFGDAAANVGLTYRQEVAWADAEDVGKILTVTADGLLDGDACEDEEVTEAVAEYLDSMCNANCLVTLEYTPIEPGDSAHKYYAPGFGLLAEVENGACIAVEGVIEEEEEEDDDE